MAEPFFSLSRQDQGEVLETIRALTGRPAHLLEKDAWIVWSISNLFGSGLGKVLTFSGDATLSKVFEILDRFSDNIILAYDIRSLAGDLDACQDMHVVRGTDRWIDMVLQRQSAWIEAAIIPILEAAMKRDGLLGELELAGDSRDALLVRYQPTGPGARYIAPAVKLGFGATEVEWPSVVAPIACDMDGCFPGVSFPKASPRVTTVSWSFWEKVLIAHACCLHGCMRQEGYSSHWSDLAALSRTEYFEQAIRDRDVAHAVARNKSHFLVEKGRGEEVVDFASAADGYLRIVPDGEALAALAMDYAALAESQMMLGDAPIFESVVLACRKVEALANRAACSSGGTS